MKKNIIIHYIDLDEYTDYEIIKKIESESVEELDTITYFIPSYDESYVDCINSLLITDEEYKSLIKMLESGQNKLKQSIKETQNNIN